MEESPFSFCLCVLGKTECFLEVSFKVLLGYIEQQNALGRAGRFFLLVPYGLVLFSRRKRCGRH